MLKNIIFLLSISVCFAGNISPKMQQEFDAYESTAKSMTSDISSRSGFQNFNIGDYTNDPSAINNPSQKKYYDNEGAIKGDAERQFEDTKSAKDTEKVYLNEPSINSKSVTNTKLAQVIANSQSITNGQSAGGLECVTQPQQCHENTQTKTCTRSTTKNITCTTNPIISYTGTVHPIMHINWTNTCPTSVTNQCNLISQECSEPGETRSVEGHNVTLDCWQNRSVYQCGSNSIDTCGNVDNCSVISSKCTQSNGKVCMQRQYEYSCSSKTCDSSKILCGSPGFCTDGKCFVPDRKEHEGSSTDFAEPVAKLAAVAAAGKDIPQKGPLDIHIEPGTVMGCKISRLYNHCTHPSSLTEKKLAKAKQKKEVIVVGKYCSSHILGFCLAWEENSCVFDSEFAKVVQQYGKPQIHMNFGSAKNPNCVGFTVDQFQKLNFDKMDFSELYSDVINATNIPSKAEIIKKAQDRIDS